MRDNTTIADPAKAREALGPAWCERFPCTKAIDDLVPEFAAKVRAFISALMAGGATVTISNTYRPAERAYLMHYACMIAQSGQDPAAIAPMDGVPIDWTAGGDRAKAKVLAAQMVAAYRIQFPAALASRHTQRRAIDMQIDLPARPAAVLKFIGPAQGGKKGKVWVIGAGDLAGLYKFGAAFGVIKLVADGPHWSDDGH